MNVSKKKRVGEIKRGLTICQKYSKALLIILKTGFYFERDGEPAKGILLNVRCELILSDNGAGI